MTSRGELVPLPRVTDSLLGMLAVNSDAVVLVSAAAEINVKFKRISRTISEE